MMRRENDEPVDQFCLWAKREEFLFSLGLNPDLVDWDSVKIEWAWDGTYLHWVEQGVDGFERHAVLLAREDLEYARILEVF